MKPEERSAQQEQPAVDQQPAGETGDGTEEKPPYEPYRRSTRIKAWIGVAAMVFLVIMYTYSIASGKIMAW